MAEAMKARIMARVEAASLEAAQLTEAPAANAAAKAPEEKAAVQKAKAQARAEDAEGESTAGRSKLYQRTPSEKAERLRHEKEAKQLAQANRAHQAKAARAGIGTASVVLTPYGQLQKALREDSDAEGDDAPEAPAPPANESAVRGKSKKGVAFAGAPVGKKEDEQKKDVAYYRAEIAAAEVLGKHDIAEALYNEARARGLKLPHWRSDGARARQLTARPAPVMKKDMTPAQYAMQMMELEPDEESPKPEPAPAAPVVQVMDRPEGSSEPIEAAVEELGSTITIRLQQARYDTTLGEPWRATTKAVSGTVVIHSSKRDRLTLHFSSTDRAKGNLKGKITTPPPPKPRRASRNPDDSGSSSDEDVDDDLYAKDLVLAEFYREGARAYPGVKKTGGGKNLCEVSVGGVVHGSIPGGDSLPEFRRTIQHLSDRKDDDGAIAPRNEGGVTMVQGYICCPCQTQKNQLLVSGKSARAPGKALTELDASFYSMQDGCDTSCRMDKRKMVCKLPGNAHARLEVLIMFAYIAASLLTEPPK